MQSKSQLDVIYTDFSSAFQSVDHRFLLHKLQTSFGVSGQMLSLFGSYLTQRRQRVVLDGVTSEWCAVASGVPEGSILGPSLFLAFINDIPERLKSNCLLYADDLKLFRAVTDVRDGELVQNDLDQLHSWSQSWQITLNPTKCFHLRLSLKTKPLPVRFSIGGTQLSLVPSMRDLGVIIDSKLNFSDHVDFIVKRGNRALGLLIRSLQDVRGGYSKGGVIAAYYANVRSILEYGSVLWAGAASSHLDRLERIQHKFLWLPSGYQARSLWHVWLRRLMRVVQDWHTGETAHRFRSFFFYTVSCQGESRAHCCWVSFRCVYVPARATRNPELLFVPPDKILTDKVATRVTW